MVARSPLRRAAAALIAEATSGKFYVRRHCGGVSPRLSPGGTKGRPDARDGVRPAFRDRTAEVTRAYSNFRVPPVDGAVGYAHSDDATLVHQSEGLSALLPAADAEPAQSTWRSAQPYQAEVVRLYRIGRSLTVNFTTGRYSLGHTVARLLDRAGVRAQNGQRPLA
jgi:hypothetical protein